MDDTADCSAVDGVEPWAAEDSEVSFDLSVTANTLSRAPPEQAPNTAHETLCHGQQRHARFRACPPQDEIPGRKGGAKGRGREDFRNV
ncbi:hypothetical protein NBRGN_016_01240 [Nocardia brasiliensis NBRC 14402]|nr:hypothetical protein NBRGN_016_01240 [Nocardia brasiliensis NBRC 14402]